MTRPWTNAPVGKPAALVDCLNAALPRLETARLILRPCRIDDWAQLEPIWTTERSIYIGGPMNAEDAWLDFAQSVASWLVRGTGSLTITLKDDDMPLGIVSIAQEFGDPETEIGWLLTEAAEGNGYATEAADALQNWGYDMLGRGNFVSYVHKDNRASHRAAARLGATPETTSHPPFADCVVYRHGGAT